MPRLYALLLRLYPVEYRALFAAEMLRVLVEAGAQGRAHRLAEPIGLLLGAAREWRAKLSRPRSYLMGRQPPYGEMSPEARIEWLVGLMVHAIAHHDFPGARHYADQEATERANLRRLRPHA